MLQWLDSQQPLQNKRSNQEINSMIASTKKEDRQQLSNSNPCAYNKLKHNIALKMTEVWSTSNYRSGIVLDDEGAHVDVVDDGVLMV